MNINDLITARYEAGGRGPDAFDCFGLFAELCRRRGIALPDHPSPAQLSLREERIRQESAHWVPLDLPEEGCAVVFRIGPWVSHIGMVLAGGKFIHATSRLGIAITSLDDVRWASRIAGFYRYGGAHE